MSGITIGERRDNSPFERLTVTGKKTQRSGRDLVGAILNKLDARDRGVELTEPFGVDLRDHDLETFAQGHESAVTGTGACGDIGEIHRTMPTIGDTDGVLYTVDKTRGNERRGRDQCRFGVDHLHRDVTLEAHRRGFGERTGGGEIPERMEELAQIVGFAGKDGHRSYCGNPPRRGIRRIGRQEILPHDVEKPGTAHMDNVGGQATVHVVTNTPENEQQSEGHDETASLQGAAGDVTHGTETAGEPGEGAGPPEEAPQDGRTLWFDIAEGVDPDAPDPGCVHEWQHIQFLDEEDGDLACGRCGRVWIVEEDPREAMLALWQSSRLGLRRMQHKLDRIAALLETVTGTLHCHWCDLWQDDTDAVVPLGARHACPEHIGQLLATKSPLDERELAAARAWFRVLRTDTELYAAWLQEKAAIECPELPEHENEAEELGERIVTTDGAWATLLGVGEKSTVNQLVRATCRFLELPTPVSRPGRALILGCLARTEWAADVRSLLNEQILSEILQEAIPSENRERATVVLDLYRDDMPDGGTLDGDMADDLIEALVLRISAELSTLFR